MPENKDTGIVFIRSSINEASFLPFEDKVLKALSDYCDKKSYLCLSIGRNDFSEEKQKTIADWFSKNALSSALFIDFSGEYTKERIIKSILSEVVIPERIMLLNFSERIRNTNDDNEAQAVIDEAKRNIDTFHKRYSLGKKLDYSPFNPKKRVVVVGGGIAGIECAIKLAEEGFGAAIVEREESLGGVLRKVPAFYNSDILPSDFLEEKIKTLESLPNIDLLLNGQIESIKGEAGDMKVSFENGEERKEIDCGAVVIAGGVWTGISADIKRTIPDDERIISLSDFCEKRDEIIEKIKSSADGKAILFAGNYSKTYSPVLFSSLLFNALKLYEETNLPVAVAIANAEVAREGAEELYTEVREKGITLFKTLEKMPEIFIKDGDLYSAIDDIYLKGEGMSDVRVLVDCALIVIEDSVERNFTLEAVAEKIRMKTGPRASIQPENLNLLAVDTNKNGIFVCGSCRQVSDISEIERDAENVVASIKRTLDENLKYPSEKIIVDKGKCTLCLTCVRVCPHGAIEWSRAAEISQINCMGCGTCTSECPNRAITLSSFSDEEVYCELEGLI